MIQIDQQTLAELDRKHLRYISDDTPGIKKIKRDSKFIYLDPNGVKISNQNILERIESLAIPPGWEEVWVCPFQHGHLQATGKDQKGRKQYIYHLEWTKISQENKFSHLPIFALSLPKIRGAVSFHMELGKLAREKVLATVVWLLEHTFIRIGNEEYARDNNSFGLTTLRNKHVSLDGKNIVFEFKGKSGIKHTIKITHPSICKTIKKCVELPGFELFQYLDADNNAHVVDSADVNEYLRQLTKQDISAKDFRTWGGTILSAVTLFEIGPFASLAEGKKNISQAVKKVSKHLRNTPKVCKNYYIHPTVINTYQQQILIPHFKKNNKSLKKGLTQSEYALFTLLQKY